MRSGDKRPMADKEKRKRTVVLISSSSSSEEESESEYEDFDSRDEEFEEISQDSSDGGHDDGEEDGDDEESLCNRVICYLQEGKDLEALHLKHCKAYLRRHGLRLAGTKGICIQRIKEHCRIKDGNGERIYPRSSFAINCTGDVCKGDVVLFTQKVHERFNKVTRHGKLLGRRTVAGRVVKESYGSAKQQHTFTIEVFWSKGVKKLPTLFPLLVKGRNLYKMRTFRQRWDREAERLNVLDEKHIRGAAARSMRGMKKSKTNFPAKKDLRHHKRSDRTRPSQTRRTAELEKRKQVDVRGRDMYWQKENWMNHCPVVSSRQLNLNTTERLDSSKSSGRQCVHMVPTLQSYTRQHPYLSRPELSHVNVIPSNFLGHGVDSTFPTVSLPPFRHYYASTTVMPASQNDGFNHRNVTPHDYSNPRYCMK